MNRRTDRQDKQQTTKILPQHASRGIINFHAYISILWLNVVQEHVAPDYI